MTHFIGEQTQHVVEQLTPAAPKRRSAGSFAPTEHVGESLGSHLRAARLGFRWLHEIERYMKLSDVDDKLFEIIVTQAGALPSRVEHRAYRVWWDGNDGVREEIVETIRPFIVDEPVQTFIIDFDGNLVDPVPA